MNNSPTSPSAPSKFPRHLLPRYLATGWIFAILVAAGIYDHDAAGLANLIEKYALPYGPIIIASITSQFLCMRALSPWLARCRPGLPTAGASLVVAVLTFESGALAASLLNVLYVALTVGDPSGETAELWLNYGAKPLFWLSVIGIPCSACLGLLLGAHLYKRR